MEIYTTSQARSNLFKICNQVSLSHEPTYIVGKKSKVVVISDEDYRSLIETAYLTSIPKMKESILKASKQPLKTYSKVLDWDNV